MNFSFVDIETSGTHVRHDRVIEVGILRVENGVIVKTYNQLINPETYVSPFITQMTGIQQEDLESAPTFETVKDEIYSLLQDSIFVAHNVRFDHGFLKNEFRRYQQDLKLKQLCTVRLSRALYPQFRHHNLDAIVKRFGFAVKNRHRAFDDAEVLWKLFQMMELQHKPDALQSALKRLIKTPSIPIRLPESDIETLHDGPGVYLFYGDHDIPLYIGKSKNVRKRVLSHFTSDHKAAKEMDISNQIKRIEVIKTAGELGALLKEAELIKKMKPVHNHLLREKQSFYVLRQSADSKGYSKISIERVASIDPSEATEILGMYRTKRQAKEVLQQKAEEYHLCHKLLDLENPKGACFQHKIESCFGACVGKENPLKYNIRFIEAFGNRIIKEWPFDDSIQIHEEDPIEGLAEDFWVNNWCLISDATAAAHFDYDTYKILVRYLFGKHSHPNIHLTTNRLSNRDSL